MRARRRAKRVTVDTPGWRRRRKRGDPGMHSLPVVSGAILFGLRAPMPALNSPVRADHVARSPNYRAFQNRVSHRPSAYGGNYGWLALDRGGAGRGPSLTALWHA